MCAKQFESFLVEQFLLHAEGNIRAGYRYQFNSPDHGNSQRLFDALLRRKDGEIIVSNKVALSYVSVQGCKVVPVLHGEEDGESGFTENYISHLRDEIASQEGALKGCALVVIHNSRLDTLINSAEDLGQLGKFGALRTSKSHLAVLLNKLTNPEMYHFACWMTSLTRS
ncbi:cell division protein FtsK [Vibrio sp. JCM 18905]|nr:cell division protein FtsK [Vibrio sp. JCM 18905]